MEKYGCSENFIVILQLFYIESILGDDNRRLNILFFPV